MECKIENSVFEVSKLQKTNSVNALGYHDRCIKLYGVFIYNSLNGKNKMINKFTTIDEANSLIESIKMNPSKYVNEDGNYKVNMKIIIEAGETSGDCIPAMMGVSAIENKRIGFVL